MDGVACKVSLVMRLETRRCDMEPKGEVSQPTTGLVNTVLDPQAYMCMESKDCPSHQQTQSTVPEQARRSKFNALCLFADLSTTSQDDVLQGLHDNISLLMD